MSQTIKSCLVSMRTQPPPPPLTANPAHATEKEFTTEYYLDIRTAYRI